MSKWPFCFDPDDVGVEIYYDDQGNESVILIHRPTSVKVSMGALATRDANLEVGFRRLDLALRSRERSS